MAGARRRTRASAAARIVSISVVAESWTNSRTPSCGLASTSTAPSSRARIAASVPRVANPEQTTTGIGSSDMILRRKVSPSMRGISRSSRITSGRDRPILSSAMYGSAATVTTSPGSCDRTTVTAWRTTAESSTTKTLRTRRLIYDLEGELRLEESLRANSFLCRRRGRLVRQMIPVAEDPQVGGQLIPHAGDHPLLAVARRRGVRIDGVEPAEQRESRFWQAVHGVSADDSSVQQRRDRKSVV